MKTVTAHLVGTSPYSQSRAHESDKLDKETPDLYEKRTWREKCHATSDGRIFIPPMGFKQALDVAASMLGMKIPGKKNSTYTKFFKSGVLCMDRPVLPINKSDLQPERIYANADGVRGSGKRVWRIFPVIQEWEADVIYHVMANEITEDVFEEHLIQSGSFVGIGRFRPQNGGFFGRFEVKKLSWN